MRTISRKRIGGFVVSVVCLTSWLSPPAFAAESQYLVNYVPATGYPPECALWAINRVDTTTYRFHDIGLISSSGWCNVWNLRPGAWLQMYSTTAMSGATVCGFGVNPTNNVPNTAYATTDRNCNGASATAGRSWFAYWKSGAGMWATHFQSAS